MFSAVIRNRDTMKPVGKIKGMSYSITLGLSRDSLRKRSSSFLRQRAMNHHNCTTRMASDIPHRRPIIKMKHGNQGVYRRVVSGTPPPLGAFDDVAWDDRAEESFDLVFLGRVHISFFSFPPVLLVKK